MCEEKSLIFFPFPLFTPTLYLMHGGTLQHHPFLSIAQTHTNVDTNAYTNTPTPPEIEAETVSVNLSAHVLIMSPFWCLITLR